MDGVGTRDEQFFFFTSLTSLLGFNILSIFVLVVVSVGVSGLLTFAGLVIPRSQCFPSKC